jgi:large subunit ribosomal protein L3
MSLGILGKKVGMTRVYDADGVSTPVTVIEATPNVVSQVRPTAKNGVSSVQLGFEDVSDKRASKPLVGHYKKAGTPAKRFAREFKVEGESKVGDTVTVSIFEAGQFIDVIGVSKGKGFQGVVRRWGFGGQPASHGSMMHRRTGAIGCRSTPGRVYKNQKMPGHMGDRQITTQNLKVVQVRNEENLLLIKGAIPGSKGSLVVVRPALKKPAKKK